jgi:hypothetical protein
MEGDFCYGLFPTNHQPLLHALLAEKNTRGSTSGSAWPSICPTRDLRRALSGRGLSSDYVPLDFIGHCWYFLTIMKRLFHAENAAGDVGFPAH